MVTTWEAWKRHSQQDVHSINQDPLFVNVAADDFRLTLSSPCSNAGVNRVLKGGTTMVTLFHRGRLPLVLISGRLLNCLRRTHLQASDFFPRSSCLIPRWPCYDVIAREWERPKQSHKALLTGKLPYFFWLLSLRQPEPPGQTDGRGTILVARLKKTDCNFISLWHIVYQVAFASSSLWWTLSMRLSQFLRIALFLLSLCLLTESLGYLTHQLYHFLGIFLLAFYGLTIFPFGKRITQGGLFILGCLLLIISLFS